MVPCGDHSNSTTRWAAWNLVGCSWHLQGMLPPQSINQQVLLVSLSKVFFKDCLSCECGPIFRKCCAVSAYDSTLVQEALQFFSGSAIAMGALHYLFSMLEAGSCIH